ncbi:MAG: hypothetical protein JWN33_29 [Candidatus Saccharibacteria bacterium]|nr:hypothetical protein [Candidatus Saccharibacteria bacterium]
MDTLPPKRTDMIDQRDETAVNSEPAAELDPALIERARKLFEVDSIEYGHPSTYLGYVYLQELDSVERLDKNSDEDVPVPDERVVIGRAINAVKGSLGIIDELSYEGEDLFTDRFVGEELLLRLLQRCRSIGKIVDQAESELEEQKALHHSGKISEDVLLDAYEKTLFLNNRYISAANTIKLIELLSGDKHHSKMMVSIRGQERADERMGRSILQTSATDLSTKTEATKDYLFALAARNPSTMRRDVLRQVNVIRSGELDALILPEYPDESEEQDALPDIDVDFELLRGEELNFHILPGDTNLRDLSEDVYKESTDEEKVWVDLGRIQVLEEVRQLFGKDKCYFARGTHSGATYAHGDHERIAEDFIVLVMQNHDKTGTVISEDALAISPISRRHAAFYMRQDASEGLSWREVFSLTKEDAKDLGVRKLKFISPVGMDVYEAMREKVFALATCPPEEFCDELRYDERRKQYVTRRTHLRRALAAATSQMV